MYRIRAASYKDHARLFEFYKGVYARTDLLLPRTEEQIGELIQSDCLFVAEAESGEFCSVCYTNPNDDNTESEYGGAFTQDGHRGSGISSALARIAIVNHLMFFAEQRPRVIAHVHNENQAPRAMLGSIGFVTDGKIEYHDGSKLEGLRQNERGQVEGLTYRLNDFDKLLNPAKFQSEKWSVDVTLFADNSPMDVLEAVRAQYCQ